MLFIENMSRKKIYLYSTLLIIVFFIWLFSKSDNKNVVFSEHIKVSLREVGHQLLLTNNDSTSLVLPVIELKANKYALLFDQKLTFLPNDLVKIVKQSLQTAKLPENYRVSVIQQNDNEVAYSYEMNADEEKTIIPCSGRYLPENNYTIEVRFFKKTVSILNIQK